MAPCRAIEVCLRLVSVAALCGCRRPRTTPASGRRQDVLPPARHAAVTIGALGLRRRGRAERLYAQALRAKGFPVTIKRRISTSEVIDHVTSGGYQGMKGGE